MKPKILILDTLYLYLTLILQVCEVADNLLLSKIKRECDFSKGVFSIARYEQTNQEVAKRADILYKRCGFFDEGKTNLSICRGHLKEYTDNWTKKYSQSTTCMNIYHYNVSKTAISKKKSGWPCTLEKSKEYWEFYGSLIPVDSFVCEMCHKWMKKEIEKAKKEVKDRAVDRDKLDKALKEVQACTEAAKKAQEAAEAAAAKAENAHCSHSDKMDVDDNITDYCPSSHGERDDFLPLSQDSIIELKKGHINKLFELDGLDLRCESTLRHKIELDDSYKPKNPSDARTYRRTLQCMANAFVSIIHAMVSDPDEDYKMYRALVSSRHILKLLQGQPLPDRIVTEILRSINAASSNNQLVERLSLLTPFMTYPELSLFFPTKKKGKAVQANESDTEGIDDQMHNNWNTDAIKVRLSKVIGKRNWNLAVNHYIRFGHSLESIDTVHRRQSLPMKTLTKIMDFFCSKQVLQQVS